MFLAAFGVGHILAVFMAGLLRLGGPLLDALGGLTVESSWAISVLLWLRWTRRGNAASVGLRRPKAADPFIGMAMGIGILIASGIAAAISMEISKALLGRVPRSPDVTEPFRGAWQVAGILLIVVAAPICEEILFRGFLFRGLRARMSFIPAALITSGLFGIIHGHPLRLLPTATGGFLLAVLYEHRRNLVAPIAAHMTLNGIIVLTIFSRR